MYTILTFVIYRVRVLVKMASVYSVGIAAHQLLGGIAVVLNSIEVLIFWRRNNPLSNFEIILLSLSVSDIIAGFSCIAIGSQQRILNSITKYDNKKVVRTLVEISESLGHFGVISSLLHVLLITVDRFLTVHFPVIQKKYSSKIKLKGFLAVIWVVSLSFPFFFNDLKLYYARRIFLVVSIIFISVFMVITYILILKKIFAVKKEMLKTLDAEEKRGGSKRREISQVKREKSSLVTSIGIWLCFVLCNYPVVYDILHQQKKDVSSLLWSLLCLNAVVDPVIYFLMAFFRKRTIRITFPALKRVQRNSKKRQDSNDLTAV